MHPLHFACCFTESHFSFVNHFEIHWALFIHLLTHSFIYLFKSSLYGCCFVPLCPSLVTFSVSFELYVHACLQASVDNIMKEKMPKKGGRWWFSWRSRNSDSKSVSPSTLTIVFFLLHVQLYTSKIKESSEDTNTRLEAKVHTLFSATSVSSGVGSRGGRSR